MTTRAVVVALVFLAASFASGSESRVRAADPLPPPAPRVPTGTGWQTSPSTDTRLASDFYLTGNPNLATLQAYAQAHSEDAVYWFQWACKEDNPANLTSNLCGNPSAYTDEEDVFHPAQTVNCKDRTECDQRLKNAVAARLLRPEIRSLGGMFIDYEVLDGRLENETYDLLQNLVDRIKLHTNPETGRRLAAGLWTNPIPKYPAAGSNGLGRRLGDLFDIVPVMLNHPTSGSRADCTLVAPPASCLSTSAYVNEQLVFWQGTSAQKMLILDLWNSDSADADLALDLLKQDLIQSIAIWRNIPPNETVIDEFHKTFQPTLFQLGAAGPSHAAPSCWTAFQQDFGNGGSERVAIEAEHFHEEFDGRVGETWRFTNTPVDDLSCPFDARHTAITTADLGVPVDDVTFKDLRAETKYRVFFGGNPTPATPDKYYVWLRGRGATASSGSAHVGVDGVDRINGKNIGIIGTTYRWSGNIGSSTTTRAWLTITSPGYHSINLWVRDDGTSVDKIFLTTNPDFVPNVPVESPLCAISQCPSP